MKILADSFVAQAKDKQENPTVMSLSPGGVARGRLPFSPLQENLDAIRKTLLGSTDGCGSSHVPTLRSPTDTLANVCKVLYPNCSHPGYKNVSKNGLPMSAIACSSVIIVHPSRLFSEALAGVVTRALLKLEHVSIDIDDVPFEKNSGSPLFLVGGSTPGHLADTLRNIKVGFCRSPIVAMGSSSEPHVVLMALQAGAGSYLHEEVTSETLIMALELVLRGQTVLPSAVVSLMAGFVAAKCEDTVPSPPECIGAETPFISPEQVKRNNLGLSARQNTVLQALIDGTPNKVIAHRLRISEATVKLHVKAVLRKINVSNRTQAAVWGVRQASNSHTSSHGG